MHIHTKSDRDCVRTGSKWQRRTAAKAEAAVFTVRRSYSFFDRLTD